MTARRILACVLFALVVAGSLETKYLRMLFGDLAAAQRAIASIPDGMTPGYREFLQEVARTTRRGDRIAILVPMRDWNRGYAYAYYRAHYFLPGREVIPLVAPDNRAHLERVAESDYIAAWAMPLPESGYRVVWSAHGGALVRRGE